MPVQVGLIASLQGKAMATNTSGKETILSVNSPVFEGDIITPAIGSEAIIETLQSEKIIIQGNTPTEIDVLAPNSDSAPKNPTSETALEQVEQLQQNILSDSDFDFSQLEFPAAGTSEGRGHPAPPVVELTSNTISQNQVNDFRTFDSSDSVAPSEASIIDESALVTLSGRETESAPVFLGDTHVSVTEDFVLNLEGEITAGATFVPDTFSTQYGEISYNEQGDWHYTLNNTLAEVQQLGAGDTLGESIELIAVNGDQFLVGVTINGSNDFPVLTGSTTGTISEDGFDNLGNSDLIVSVTGQLDIQDPDIGEARFMVEHNIATTYGSAEINALGQWRYELSNELNPVQGLSEGQTLSDHFTVNTLDGTRQLIQITIEGTDDAPILTGSNFGKIDLGSSTEASGSLSIEDPDFGQSHFQADSEAEGTYGTGSIDESGQWFYQVDSDNPAINSLGENESIFDTFNVVTADGTEKEVIIKIGGSDAQISNISQAPIIEISTLDPLLTFNSSSVEGLEADVYIWNAEKSTSDTTSATESISHFNTGEGGDILQLNDLLIDTQDESNLEQFLHFSFDGQDTTLEIHPEGLGDEESHFLVLNNIDLTSFGNSDSEIIHQLINDGNLDIAGL